MQKHHTKLIEALERVEGFLDTNQGVMASVITSKAHQNFTASRERMVEHMKAQDEHTRGIRRTVATKQRLAVRVIRAHMRPITIVARKQLPTAGEFGALRVPGRRGRLVALVAAGHGMARAAKLHEATFLEAGLPADFIERLAAATDALSEAITAKGETEALRVRATSGLRKEGRVASFALRLIDTMVRSAIETDNVLLDEWTKVSRVAAAAISPRALNDPASIPVGPVAPGATPSQPTIPPQEVRAAA